MPADSLFNNFMINYFGIIVNRLRINLLYSVYKIEYLCENNKKFLLICFFLFITDKK